MSKSIKFKNLLPESQLQIEVNTKLLPTKGTLVYEYNPFRNYRLNEIRFLYNNRFYTEKELLNNLNIISNIIFVKNKEVNYIYLYTELTRISHHTQSLQLNYSYTSFNLNHIEIRIPQFNNKQDLYFSELELLNSNNHTQIKIAYEDANSYLKTSNNKYVTGYNPNDMCFIFGDKEDAIIGIDKNIFFTKNDFDLIHFHLKSSTFYLIVNDSVYEVKDQISKFHPGSLVDFSTNELKFNLSHPVQIVPQYAYDGSVNLIMSDGYSKPKLINSRFSTIGKNLYLIVDRRGNNDTNIYNLGDAFDIDTSLYKQVSRIPKLTLHTVYQGGLLSVGNYHFYITYSDADGNETDFVAETGLVSLFLGTDTRSIRQGFRNENSFKGVKLLLTNIDPSYSYVNVYFTRATGDIMLSADTLAFKLTNPIFINNTLELEINITGYEEITGISISDINPLYHVVETAETLVTSNNMLFLGNVTESTPNYSELSDLALHFTPCLDTSEDYINLNKDYTQYSSINKSYYDPKYIYEKVGYWPEEIYRFGIVFILHDNTLTPVFNVRGINNLSEDTIYTKYDIYDENGKRKYIDVNENTSLLVLGNISELENSKGVVRLHSIVKESNNNKVLGIRFELQSNNREDVLKELLKVCKGYFFVRQRRIPTVLCEALSIGIDKLGHHPCLPVPNSFVTSLENKKLHKKNSVITTNDDELYVVKDENEVLTYKPYANFKNDIGYVTESFMNMHRLIVNNFEERLRILGSGSVETKAMICPDYDLNYPYYNSIFNGAEFSLIKSNWLPSNNYLNTSDRHFYFENYTYNSIEPLSSTLSILKVKVLGVEDATPLVGINNSLYSGVAGAANFGYKFDYIGSEDKTTEASNLIRGIWGPFLAIDSLVRIDPATIYTIMIPGYDPTDMENYFKIRYSDKNAYYTISDRFLLDNIDDNEKLVIYRGDCYICLFTHRINRNFNDDTAPYNDTIVNPGTWRGENNGLDEDNKPNPGFEVEDGVIKLENFNNINLGDLNAVKLGHWITFLLRSSFNLNVRSIDESDVNTVTRVGHGKGFYPYFPMSPEGSYKMSDALCVNKGYEKSVSERYAFTYPDIPAQKNSFTNRILHSLPSNNDAFKNGYRVFHKTSLLDYLMTYGAITKILEYKENLLIIFEHGIGLAGINDKALLTNAQGPNVYLQTNKVLPKELTVVSDCYGSQWKDSIVKTPYSVYGVDTTAKKIWKFSNKGLEIISDRTVLAFLNKNISLTERELNPILGIRNVKTHYNRFKNDVMFTFYDDLENSQEKVWNLCYNENMLLFVTFYSWLPSYSDNISNLYFSFDRQTSKWIAKLGISTYGSDFAQGIVLEGNSVLPDTEIIKNGYNCIFGNLKLHNIEYLEIHNIELLRDNLLTYRLFNVIKRNNNYQLVLDPDVKAIDLISELYYRTSDGENILSYNRTGSNEQNTYNTALLMSSIKSGLYFPIAHDSSGRRMELPNPINKNKIVYILNLRCAYKTINGAIKTIENSIAVTLKYNLQFLSTDFWKHGTSGIIDISERLKPTHWYGKQHPFEFEFIVMLNPANLKIFDNLIILSNSAEPESFHYEITGDGYEFSKDKPVMYYRQEATEAFYQYNGLDIEYDSNFTIVKDKMEHKPLYNISKLSFEKNDYKEYYKDSNLYNTNNKLIYTKSNLLSLYYSRINSYNEIEDYYRQQISANKNYDALSGAEIVWDDNSNQFNIWEHCKGVNINGPGGRLRGNMLYNEDRWVVQINPLNLQQKNESEWDVPPIVTQNSPIPNEQLTQDNNVLKLNEFIIDETDMFPDILKEQGYTSKDNLDFSKWESTKQVKLRDKYIRIRVRYSGKELAIILAVLTLFRLSYS